MLLSLRNSFYSNIHTKEYDHTFDFKHILMLWVHQEFHFDIGWVVRVAYGKKKRADFIWYRMYVIYTFISWLYFAQVSPKRILFSGGIYDFYTHSLSFSNLLHVFRRQNFRIEFCIAIFQPNALWIIRFTLLQRNPTNQRNFANRAIHRLTFFFQEKVIALNVFMRTDYLQ